jgi:multisubunit Na+/H+ antiporter MnhG subunit
VRDIVSVVLLVTGLGVVCLSCAAMASLEDAIDRLHVVTPASTIGVAATCAAVVVRDGLNASGTAAILLAVVVAGSSPLVSHACARSIAVRRREDPAGRERPGGQNR